MYNNKLKTIIEKYPDIWSYDHLFKAVLMDFYPENKLLRNLLRGSVEEGIPQQLKELDTYSTKTKIELTKSMMKAYDCSDEKAELVVDLWIDAFGLELNEKLSNEVILTYSIEELGLSVRAYNSLKRSGINTVADVMRPQKEEGWMGARNLGRQSLEEFWQKIKELGWENEDYQDNGTNQPGREKCNQLREIRKKIADANSIKFEPAECHHTGPCLGTCPVCDSEIRYLDRQVRIKKDRGEKIILFGIAADDVKEAGFNIDLEGELEYNDVDGGLIAPGVLTDIAPGGLTDPCDIDVDLWNDDDSAKPDDILMGEVKMEDIW